MKDATSYICTLCLLLLAVIGYLGYSGDQKERLEKEMDYHEEVFERASEGNRLMRCFRESYLELYQIDGELMTSSAEMAFRECAK